MASRYHEVYARWQADPEGFWAEAAGAIDWFKPWDRVFDAEAGVYGRWFAGAECNTCYNAVDRHVSGGRGDQIALIHDSAISDSLRTFTYAEVKREVVALASVLRNQGIGKGDRVIIYMPMVAEAAFAMLACARLGAVHSVVFGGFAARELATRIDDATPDLIISASCGLEPGRTIAYKPLLDGAIEMARHRVRCCIVLQRPQLECDLVEGRDLDYADQVARERAAGATIDCVPVLATDPLYILYTSGTTGQPKGVVRDNGGHMVALAWSMENEFGVRPGEVFWAASDVGWVVGHSYIVYAPLITGCTTVLFEGKPVGTPDAGTFWRVIAQHGVVALFTAPTAFRAIKKEDPQGTFVPKYDLSKFRTLFLAGERADPETIKWAERQLNVPVIDHWWQTETGSPVSQNPVGLGMLPVKYGSPGVPMPGYDVRVLDDARPRGRARHARQCGREAAAAAWLPADAVERGPALLRRLSRGVSRLLQDGGRRHRRRRRLPLHHGRAPDDIINVAGHRLSTGAMEEVLAEHRDVAECAVIGIADALKGQVPCGFVVLNSGVDRDPGRNRGRGSCGWCATASARWRR
jgi:propionyl-CoA synthetase